MPLVPCLECGARISTQAAACPKCGSPNSATKSIGIPLATTQLTSKHLKAQMLFAAILFWFGLIVLIFDTVWKVQNSDQLGSEDYSPTPLVMIASWAMLIGIIWWGVTKLRIWWHHK